MLDEDRYDLLFTTDVLSEGVNLQQAGHIVNYDLPWNPQRIVQRHGRIDRIGSPHSDVLFDCFFPAEYLDELLGLEEKLQRKLAYANAAVGVGQVLPGQVTDPNVEVAFADIDEVHDQIRSLYGEATLLENNGGSAALSERSTASSRQGHGRPIGAGGCARPRIRSRSGLVTDRVRRPGWVFCTGADHPKPWLRLVTTDENGEAVVLDDTLVCLVAADPGGPDAVRDISEEATTGVFDASSLAQRNIHARVESTHR